MLKKKDNNSSHSKLWGKAAGYFLMQIFFAAILILISCNNNNEATAPAMSEEKLILTVPQRYNLNINNKIKGSSYCWWSDNEEVAKVDSKNGYVTAAGEGIAVIYCKVKSPNKE